MKKKTLSGKRLLAKGLSIALAVSVLPANVSLAAKIQPDEPVYAAAWQGATGLEDTTLPETVTAGGKEQKVEWSWGEWKMAVPYSTVSVSGSTENGDTVEAQVEVIPEEAHELVYFVDASRDEEGSSVAYEAVKELTGESLKNEAADQAYSEASGWGRVGTNFLRKDPGNVDVTKKIQTGWYSSSKTESLVYQYELDPGIYTMTAGFYEWWNNRSMKVKLSGAGMDEITSETASVSGKGSTDVVSASFEVEQAGTVTMEIQNATGGEAPVISWFAVARGEVAIPDDPVWEEDIIVNGSDVDAAAGNVNGLTYKGLGLLSGNSTSNLMIDYKDQNPDKYWEIMKVLFGGEHPLINHVKMEMGNDGNNSTGADSCTMRFEDEEADVSRSPGFQMAADAKTINPEVKVSFLRWEMPAWVQSAWNSDRTGAGYEAVYRWYKETVFDAYEKYGYVVDYIDPDKNETRDPDEDFLKWFRRRVSNETEFPDYMDQKARDAYHGIKIIASDENTTLNIVPSMRADEELYHAVDAIGFHYASGDEISTADYRKMADEDDKEVWYSEGCGSFSYTEYQENKTDSYGKGTLGGYQSPLALADNFVKSFVYSRKTHYIFQPAIGSFYEGAQYDHKEILSAREPWAGYVHYDEMIYLLEHFTKFAVTGWENEENTEGIWRGIPQASANGSIGSDHLRNEAGKPSYMTLAAPDRSNFSVVMVNNSGKIASYRIKAQDMEIGGDAPLEIWETKTDSYLQYKGEAQQEAGYYLVTLEPYSMVTATTLDCNQKEEYKERLPEDNEKTVLDTDETGKNRDTGNETLYADDFEYGEEAEGYLENRGNEPRYIVDLTGAFLVKDGQMKQVLNQSVGQWNSNEPNCVVGDFRWANYKAGVDVTLSGQGYAGINIRQQTGMGFEGSGYNLRITKSGDWTLKKRSEILASGNAGSREDGTWRLELEGKENLITAWVDGEKVASYEDPNPEYFGRVRFGCSWAETGFDNFTVEKISGCLPYATELTDNAADAVSYTGDWSIIAGGGGGSNDWYRSLSTTTQAGAGVQFKINGDGFALIGANDASAQLDVTVDGSLTEAGAATMSCSQHNACYLLTGLGNGEHTVEITVKSGKLVLDAILALPGSWAYRTDLRAAINQAKEFDGGKYTQETFKAMTQALQRAGEVYADVSSTQEEIDAAILALQEAIANLEIKKPVDPKPEDPRPVDPKPENPKPVQTVTQLAAPAVRAVKSVAAKQGSQVRITLSEVANADAYTVYRRIGKKIKKIGTSSGTVFTDRKPVSKKKALYYAVASSENSRFTGSNPGKAKAITLVADTKKVKARRTGKAVTLTFSRVKGARGYLIYRSAKKNGTYTRLTRKPVKKLTYTDKKAKAKKTYFYKIVTYGKNRTYSAGKVSGKVKAR